MAPLEQWLTALQKVCSTIPRGSSCLLILPDRGERYLETIYSDEWVRQVFGVTADKNGLAARSTHA